MLSVTFTVCASFTGYVLDDFPCLSEENLSIQDQIELVKNWKLKPDFIINIKVNTHSQIENLYFINIVFFHVL